MITLEDKTYDNLVKGLKGLIETANIQFGFVTEKSISSRIRAIRYASLRQTYDVIYGMYNVLYGMKLKDGSFIADKCEMNLIIEEIEKIKKEMGKVRNKL